MVLYSNIKRKNSSFWSPFVNSFTNVAKSFVPTVKNYVSSALNDLAVNAIRKLGSYNKPDQKFLEEKAEFLGRISKVRRDVTRLMNPQHIPIKYDSYDNSVPYKKVKFDSDTAQEISKAKERKEWRASQGIGTSYDPPKRSGADYIIGAGMNVAKDLISNIGVPDAIKNMTDSIQKRIDPFYHANTAHNRNHPESYNNFHNTQLRNRI